MKFVCNVLVCATIAALLVLCASCADTADVKAQVRTASSKPSTVRDTLKFASGIRAIFQDSKGNYWFGSDAEGVCRYDGHSYEYFDQTNGFCGKQVIDIKEDQQGAVWFSTSTGLCSYDGRRFVRRLPLASSLPFRYKSADVWFSGSSVDELCCVDGGILYTVKSPVVIPPGELAGDYGVTGFAVDSTGGLWIATYACVTYYNGGTTRVIDNKSMRYDGRSRYVHVRSILCDSKNRVWIGNNGIGVLLVENGTVTPISEKYGLFAGEVYRATSPPGTLMHVFAVEEDAEGNIWFGDRDTGVWRFDGSTFKNISVDSALNTQHVWDIYRNRAGEILVASADRGVYRYDGNRFVRSY